MQIFDLRGGWQKREMLIRVRAEGSIKHLDHNQKQSEGVDCFWQHVDKNAVVRKQVGCSSLKYKLDIQETMQAGRRSGARRWDVCVCSEGLCNQTCCYKPGHIKLELWTCEHHH